MSEINDLHNRAMDLVEFSLIERLGGNEEREASLARQALELELKAIDKLEEPVEPTFSVLHRSAGTLALRCREYRLAEQLAARALAGDPPIEIAEELRDLMEQATLSRHLELRGIELARDEVQMSLSGSGIGYGLITSDELMNRIDGVSRLLRRIVEMRRELPFLESGPRRKVRDEFQLLLSVPRAASYAVTLKLGGPSGQLHLSTTTEEIVDDFMDVMDMFGRSDIRGLEEHVPEPAYLRNFLGLAKRIAPDGDQVRQVGFTVQRGDKARRVSVTKPAVEIPLPPIVYGPTEDDRPGKPIELRGTLRYADATGDQTNRIKIVSEDERATTVTVPLGMMNDIVRPMWDSLVVVKGLRKGRAVILQDIDLQAPDSEA